MVCSQVLQQWRQTIPPQIIGFIPGRNPHTPMIHLQFELEKRLIQLDRGKQWQGTTLDLVKCFNLLARWPCKIAMQHCGLPADWAEFWFQSLMGSTRWWKVNDSLFQGGTSTTFAPEGDSWSVAACVAIATIWANSLTSDTIHPSAYADNWGWRAKSTPGNVHALRQTTHYTQSLRLRIDWNKTWTWTTDSRNKDQWKAQMKEVYPPEVDMLVVSTARELGVTLNYNKVHSRATQRERHEAALEQMRKARSEHLTLDTRARICAFAMSKALWGTETYVVGGELRSTMAKYSTKVIVIPT